MTLLQEWLFLSSTQQKFRTVDYRLLFKTGRVCVTSFSRFSMKMSSLNLIIFETMSFDRRRITVLTQKGGKEVQVLMEDGNDPPMNFSGPF